MRGERHLRPSSKIVELTRGAIRAVDDWRVLDRVSRDGFMISELARATDGQAVRQSVTLRASAK
jgi:hypothetical protein